MRQSIMRAFAHNTKPSYSRRGRLIRHLLMPALLVLLFSMPAWSGEDVRLGDDDEIVSDQESLVGDPSELVSDDSLISEDGATAEYTDSYDSSDTITDISTNITSSGQDTSSGDQSTVESTGQSAVQSTSQGASQSALHAVSQNVGQTANQPSTQSTAQSSTQSSVQTADQSSVTLAEFTDTVPSSQKEKEAADTDDGSGTGSGLMDDGNDGIPEGMYRKGETETETIIEQDRPDVTKAFLKDTDKEKAVENNALAGESSDAAADGDEGTDAAGVTETFVSAGSLSWFVRGIEGEIQGASAYAGTQQLKTEAVAKLGDAEGPAPKTLILIANSRTVGYATDESIDQIQTILLRLIWNHNPRERFALKTFSVESETLVDYTDNYDTLRRAIQDELTFQEQKTCLRNVLYKEIVELAEDGGNDYDRIVLIADGTDDSRNGVTYEELYSLLGRDNYSIPIYTVGMAYGPEQTNLDLLFALSRRTQASFYWIEDYKDPREIADGISEDLKHITYFRFGVPTELCNGETKVITLSVLADEQVYTMAHAMAMPVATVEQLEEMKTAQEEEQQERARVEQEAQERLNMLESELDASAQRESEAIAAALAAQSEAYAKAQSESESRAKETETETETETQIDSETARKEWQKQLLKRNMRSAVWIIAGMLLMVMIGFAIYGDQAAKKEKKEFKEAEMPEEEAEIEVDKDAKLTKCIILTNMAQPDLQYTIPMGVEKVLGRSRARCDIAFPEDRSMAGRQARIYFEFGKVFIENLDTLGSTRVNDEVINGALELENGARLQMGDTRLRVQYE